MKYKEPKSLNSVSKFHKSFAHPISNSPRIPTEERCELRVSLIAEELNELREGIINKDIVEVSDALCDIQYVLSGAILEFGLAEIFSDLFEEVQRSNMSKACKSIEEAENSIAYYVKNGTPCHYEKKGDYYILYRDSDHKILKSIYYSPAELTSIIQKSK